MRQMSFPFYNDTQITSQKNLTQDSFSHNSLCDESERLLLETRYSNLLEETSKFNRQNVSFQANKTERLHSWIKYREGFSAQLVELLLSEFGIEPD